MLGLVLFILCLPPLILLLFPEEATKHILTPTFCQIEAPRNRRHMSFTVSETILLLRYFRNRKSQQVTHHSKNEIFKLSPNSCSNMALIKEIKQYCYSDSVHKSLALHIQLRGESTRRGAAPVQTTWPATSMRQTCASTSIR